MRARQRGFTLLEVLMALFVVGAAIGLYAAVLYVFSVTRTSEHRAVALRIAEHKLSQLRAAGYDSLPSVTTFSDAQFSLLPAGATSTLAVTVVNASTKQVVVGVSWSEPGKSTSTVSVGTLLTQNGGL